MSGTNMTIAKEIVNQLGNQALYIIGAKNLAADANSLSFKIMRNSQKITHIKIELNAMDTYDIEFLNCRGYQRKVIKSYEGVYCDRLHYIIQETTKLSLSLTKHYT